MSVGEGFEAPGRTDCAIYYTNDTERCDTTPFTLADGSPCKLNFTGWNRYPYKLQQPPQLNAVAISDKGPPENWAWCFKKADTAAAAGNIVKAIGNRGPVHADTVVSDLGDGAAYARIKFNTFAYDKLKPQYCNENIVSRTQFEDSKKEALIAFGGSQPFGVYMLTNDGIIRDAKADVAAILRKLYTLVVNGTELKLTPNPVTVAYYQLKIDLCGRPELISSVIKPFNIADIGAPSLVLVKAASVDDDLYGDLAALNDRMRQFTEQATALKKKSTSTSDIYSTRAASYLARKDKIEKTIGSINTNAANFYNTLLTTLKPTTAKFAKGDISSDGRVYISVGTIPSDVPLTTNLNTAMPTPPEKQLLVDNVLDISTLSKISTPKINYANLPTYTITLWIKVTNDHNAWRNVLLIGDDDSDRTPGIYIWPSQPNVPGGRIHFRQASTTSKNDGLDLPAAMPFGKWYHFAAVVTPDSIALYTNGTLTVNTTLPLGQNYVWGNSRNKSMYLGLYGAGNSNGPVLIQKLRYVAGELSAGEIKTLAGEMINNTTGMGNASNAAKVFEKFAVDAVPVAPVAPVTMDGLLNKVTASGVYDLGVGNRAFKVYVQVFPKVKPEDSEEKWLLVLNYRRRGNTNPPLAPQYYDSGSFPLFESEDLAATKNEANTESWGHLTPDFLNMLNPKGVELEMRFYAKSSSPKGSLIHFKTSDPNVIKYATTGQGSIPATFPFTPLTGHIASLPDNNRAPQCGGGVCVQSNQGIWALTNHTFWRWGQAHWNIGVGGRWEVDDYTPLNGENNNTYHSVWIRLKKPEPVKQVNYTLPGNTNKSFELGPWNMGPWWNTGFADKAAKWIWNISGAAAGAPVNEIIIFQTIIQNNSGREISAVVHIIVDDASVVRLNKATLTTSANGGWWQGTEYPKVAITLLKGNNILEFECINGGGPAGFIYSVIGSAKPNNILARSTADTVWLRPEKSTYGNNGTVSCETYCRGTGGRAWNGELPNEWKGAKCIATNKGICTKAAGYQGGVVCTCQQTGAGWK